MKILNFKETAPQMYLGSKSIGLVIISLIVFSYFFIYILVGRKPSSSSESYSGLVYINIITWNYIHLFSSIGIIP